MYKVTNRVEGAALIESGIIRKFDSTDIADIIEQEFKNNKDTNPAVSYQLDDGTDITNTATFNKILINLLNEANHPTQKEGQNDSGHDLRANIDEQLVIKVGKAAKIKVGFKMDLTAFEDSIKKLTDGLFSLDMTIRPRSSMCDKFVYVMIGTIDTQFHGEPTIHLINLGEDDFIVEPFEKIGQMVFGLRVHNDQVNWQRAEESEFALTMRGQKGYGSTGRF